MSRYRVLIEYDGAAFNGWQSQQGKITVQGVLEEALGTVLRRPIRLAGSGRTDAGVHATGQVAHFDAEGDPVDTFRLRRAVNGVLRARCDGAIVVLKAEAAPPGFHARYDAMERTYCYRATGQPRAIERTLRWIVRPEPDWHLMNDAAKHLLGEHHFGSFCLTGSATRNRICQVNRAEWNEEERPGDWRFVIQANRFLHGMVRAIVGTLLRVGHGHMPPASMAEVLDRRDRRAAGPAAPAHALTLVRVAYPDGFGAP